MRMRTGLLVLLLGLAACGPKAEAPVAAAPADAAASEFAAKATTIVQRYVAENRFSGAVLVAKDGAPVFRDAFGLAAREPDVAASPDNIFRIGSLTKQFTAAAIMQLVEQGKIAVSDPVSKHYPAAPKTWEKVTIKHLLTHRSGIVSYTSLPGFFEKESRTDRTPDQIIALTKDMPLEFEPGAKFAYNNTGYVILGAIIETLSGQSYADYVQQHIFSPLGMTHSGYEVSSALPAGYAQGFAMLNDKWVPAPPISMTLPYSAGSLYSTVDDLAVWEQALFADKVISKASREEMMSDQGNGYGYGLTMWKLEGHSAVSHSGGINGFSSYLIRFPDDGVTVAVLSNLGGAPADEISEELGRAYLGLPPIPPPPVLTEVAVKDEVLARYDGVYELMPGFDITVSHKDGKMVAQATGQGEFTLLATSDTEFHFQAAELKMVFPEGTGKAASFVLHQGGERVAKRVK